MLQVEQCHWYWKFLSRQQNVHEDEHVVPGQNTKKEGKQSVSFVQININTKINSFYVYLLINRLTIKTEKTNS